MASIGEQSRRVHKPPRSPLRARQEDIRAQSNKRDATSSVSFTRREGDKERKKKSKGKEQGAIRNVSWVSPTHGGVTGCGAHLRFAASRSARCRARRGHASASASVLRRSHESGDGSSTAHGHGVRAPQPSQPELAISLCRRCRRVSAAGASLSSCGICLGASERGETYASRGGNMRTAGGYSGIGG